MHYGRSGEFARYTRLPRVYLKADISARPWAHPVIRDLRKVTTGGND